VLARTRARTALVARRFTAVSSATWSGVFPSKLSAVKTTLAFSERLYKQFLLLSREIAGQRHSSRRRRAAGMTSVEVAFGAIARRLTAQDGAVDEGRMLRSSGLRTGGRFFAFARDEDLVVKLPRERVETLVAAKKGRPFKSGSRTMKEWVALTPENEAICCDYVVEALDFARQTASRRGRSSAA
jgi:hypothetical protein